MHHTRTTLGVRFALLCCLGALTLLSAGCARGDKQRTTLLEQENLDLRDRAHQLQTELSNALADRSQSESELQALNDENEQLKAELSMTPAAATGFEGISGVATSIAGGGEVVLDIAGDVLFSSGKVTLRKSARATLDQVAAVLKSSYATRTIRIAGHTDTDPIKKSKWKTNERLSAERALAVEEYLAKKGVDNKRMYVAAFGASAPKGSKKASRRVEVVIMTGDGG